MKAVIGPDTTEVDASADFGIYVIDVDTGRSICIVVDQGGYDPTIVLAQAIVAGLNSR